MEIINSVKELKDKLYIHKSQKRSIGLVPTMGALHKGHISLVEKCSKENDITVVSIFVNPTQFNDKKDLERYPRTLEADCKLLGNIKVDIVFAPSVEEIYPEPDTRTFSYPPTDTVMEGKYRPGHFNGVCQIVSKLFDFVEPDKAYFGEKDFQQVAVIKAMVKDKKYSIEIIQCPIIREDDGLALSSRNALLTSQERLIAVNISKVLKNSIEYSLSHSLNETREWVINQINSTEGLKIEYYEIVDGETLNSIDKWEDSNYIVGCITVFCGSTPIRLIDNIKYKGL
jgi:pantoate--beta-alanine ligase